VGATIGRPWLTSLAAGEHGDAPAWLRAAGTPPTTPAAEAALPSEPAPEAIIDMPKAEPVEVAAQVPEPTEAQEATVDLQPDATAQAQAAAPDTASSQAVTGRDVRRVGQARGLRDALLKAGTRALDADALVLALNKFVDFRHAQPDHELEFDRDTAGRLQRFEYRASVTERFQASRQADGSFKGSRVDVPIERRRIARGGYVSDSLGQALEALGLKNNLAGLFVEAFEGKINFKKHAREGDSFKLIVEEQYVDGQLLGYGKVQAVEYKGSRAGESRAFWFDTEGGGDFYDESGRGLHGGWLRTPVRYDHISSPFDLRRRHPILKRIMPHEGIDYAASPGTTVWAAADGVVTFVGPRGANGNLIALQHAGGYETFYAHLSRIARGVVRGAHVHQRQPIGAVGSTGRSTGPHLHFGLKRNGKFIDPAKQLNGPGKPLPDALLTKFKHLANALKHELAQIGLAPAPAPIGHAAEGGEELHEDAIDL
jgi:murein DD-endopeptidase MepM/ murein hydrolase activator NlpD